MTESACPACETVVDADEVLAADRCTSCGTALSELFRLAAGRRERA